MEIFGVGTAELIAILIIMLIVAGPKRMMQWAYILGQYTAKARRMWSEAMTYMQKEFDDAGVDIELPKDIPTRGSLNKEISRQVEKAMAPVSNPMKQVFDETSAQLKDIKTQATITDPNRLKSASTTPPNSTPASTNGKSDLGTWSDIPEDH